VIINTNGVIVFIVIRQRGEVMNNIINLACWFGINNEVVGDNLVWRDPDELSFTSPKGERY
jgi:hypothetical protein